jgi:hypothetical protein
VGSCLTGFNSRPDSSREPVSAIGKRILSQFPTRFGQLVFLASLRDSLTGRYAHPSLIEIAGREMADRTLRHHHHQVFSEWIGLNLSDQKSDLGDYLRSARLEIAQISYRDLAPSTAHDVERQLYLTDLEVVVQLLNFEQDGAFGPPVASPRR